MEISEHARYAAKQCWAYKQAAGGSTLYLERYIQQAIDKVVIERAAEIERLRKLSRGLAHQLQQATAMMRAHGHDYPVSDMIEKALTGGEE
jgi:hypothetical protein